MEYDQEQYIKKNNKLENIMNDLRIKQIDEFISFNVKKNENGID